MSEIAIFAFGSLVFIATAWATFAFGLARMHDLQLDDIQEEDSRIEIVIENGLTERYVPAGSPAQRSLKTLSLRRPAAHSEPLAARAAQSMMPALSEVVLR